MSGDIVVEKLEVAAARRSSHSKIELMAMKIHDQVLLPLCRQNRDALR